MHESELVNCEKTASERSLEGRRRAGKRAHEFHFKPFYKSDRDAGSHLGSVPVVSPDIRRGLIPIKYLLFNKLPSRFFFFFFRSWFMYGRGYFNIYFEKKKRYLQNHRKAL